MVQLQTEEEGIEIVHYEIYPQSKHSILSIDFLVFEIKKISVSTRTTFSIYPFPIISYNSMSRMCKYFAISFSSAPVHQRGALDINNVSSHFDTTAPIAFIICFNRNAWTMSLLTVSNGYDTHRVGPQHRRQNHRVCCVYSIHSPGIYPNCNLMCTWGAAFQIEIGEMK